MTQRFLSRRNGAKIFMWLRFRRHMRNLEPLESIYLDLWRFQDAGILR